VSSDRIANARSAIEHVARRSHQAEADYEMARRALEAARYDVERERERLHRLRREMDAVYSKRGDIERERVTREEQIAQALAAGADLQQRRDERRAAMEALTADLQLATERREAALRSVSEASARLASVEGERRTLAALREQHEKTIERLDSQIQAKRLQGRNLELEASVINERLGKLARELEAIQLE
jgi:chromosome segregation ATPase